jgi:hypothetical protein
MEGIEPMPYELKLTLTADCELCGHQESEIHGYDEFGIDEDDHELFVDFIERLEAKGWEVKRVSYESHEFYCLKCVEKRVAA